MKALIVVCWLFLGGTALAGEAPTEVRVPGWITVTAPAGFTPAEKQDRLSFREDGGLRTPLEIEILRNPMRTFVVTDQTRETPMGPVMWAIDEQETGGSGGPEWRLMIRHPVGWVVARQQNELGRPDFSRVWQMVDTLRPDPGS